MANYVIKADPQLIRETAANFEKQKNIMTTYMTEMKSEITNNLQNAFQSDAGRTYIEKYNEVTTDIQACLDNLQSEIETLKKVADIFENHNSKVTTDVNNLSTNKVFKNRNA